MENVGVEESETRYHYADLPFGVPETLQLDFHSPYGCSKGTGDQYVRDYHRIYGLPTVVMRQSCIYGPRQFGVEDQGWVAWFVIAGVYNRPIKIYGDGKQVRDLLFIEDMLDAYDAALSNIEVAAGQIYNIGGGVDNAISVWREFGPLLKGLLGRQIPIEPADWRPGDQLIYISDIRKAGLQLGWRPRKSVADGVRRLVDWVKANPQYFST